MGGTGGVLLPEYDEMGWLESQNSHTHTHTHTTFPHRWPNHAQSHTQNSTSNADNWPQSIPKIQPFGTSSTQADMCACLVLPLS